LRHQHGIAFNANIKRLNVFFRWAPTQRTGHAVEARSMPGTFDGPIGQYLAGRQGHALMRAFVAKGRDPLPLADEANPFP